jgi:hypothetical protein
MGISRRRLLVAGMALALPATAPRGATARILHLAGGQVFDGERFVARDLWIAGGQFVRPLRSALVERVDLTGRWIVAPFADAHSHSFGEGEPAKDRLRAAAYVRDGVLAVMSQGNLPLGAHDRAVAGTGLPGGPDVLFANAILTSPDGPLRGFFDGDYIPCKHDAFEA